MSALAGFRAFYVGNRLIFYEFIVMDLLAFSKSI